MPLSTRPSGRPSLPATPVEAEIALPAGAKMIGHGFSDGQISIDAELADGSRAIFVYDVGAQRIVGRYAVTREMSGSGEPDSAHRDDSVGRRRL